MSKKILGLDLGTNSIGWALIEESENNRQILGMGVRIVPLSTDEKDEFASGNKISKNQKRIEKRTQRKGYDRYQQRRSLLTATLIENEMFDPKLFKLDSLTLWGLRAKAAKDAISLPELGRILYHLNQKRGYKSAKSDTSKNSKETEYVANVMGRYAKLKELNLTIGQAFYNELLNNQYYRAKDQVYPREAYIEEFDKIMKRQSEEHQNILTTDFINKIKNEIIYYQRPLKSQKSLVSVCDFASFEIRNNSGKSIVVGPKVAPRSSPLFQYCKIWETVNSLSLKIKNTGPSRYKWLDWYPSLEQKFKIVSYLNSNERLSFSELLKIVELKKENVYSNKQILNGLQGNNTYSILKKFVDEQFLRFDLQIKTNDEVRYLLDKKSGEVKFEELYQEVGPSFEAEPLYRLWHTLYSIKDEERCKMILMNKFNFNEEVANELSKIDFVRFGFGNKSSKAIRKILPYLMKGYVHSDACELAGYNHSGSLTKEELLKRKVSDKLELLPKNSLRQPVVEKILNQTINVVNALIEHYGKPDEIRVELARELKQSKVERNESDLWNKANRRLNEEISGRLSELGLPITKRFIQKYKFIFPSYSKNLRDSHVANTCIYCGKNFNLSDALTGDNFDVDHIIPKALLFDDSQTNKVLVHRGCNAEKKDKTAYDFIATKGEDELNKYLQRVDEWFDRGIISYSKLQKLKVSYEEYLKRKAQKKTTVADQKLWENFIDRQIRETQYISRKAKEILQKICNEVYATEGTVTAELRKIWGWNDILMNLHLPSYKEKGLTEIKEWTSANGKRNHSKEEIRDWNKRDDHRHHAIDALVVACTKQGFIQRLNTLNASDVRDGMKAEIIGAKIVFDEKKSLLEQYLLKERPFSTSEIEKHVSRVLISFKSGKKVVTNGVRKAKINGVKKTVQSGLLIPRGPISEETIYGKIKVIEKNQPVKTLFDKVDYIVDSDIREIVKARLEEFENDLKKAVGSLKSRPILDKNGKVILSSNIFKNEYVVKYPIGSIKKEKDLEFIVDEGIKRIISKHLANFNGNFKEAFKETVWLNQEKRIPIKTVRMFTRLSSVEPIRRDQNGSDIGFVKLGNNHHVAIYSDDKGNLVEHICSFWHAVNRRLYKLPIIIKDPRSIWDKVLLDQDYSEDFLNKIPKDNLDFVISFEQNEMVILGLSNEEFQELYQNGQLDVISRHLYVVWSISEKNYWFRHHLETKNSELKEIKSAKESKRYFNIQSLSSLQNLNPIKVRIDHIGRIHWAGHF